MGYAIFVYTKKKELNDGSFSGSSKTYNTSSKAALGCLKNCSTKSFSKYASVFFFTKDSSSISFFLNYS